MPRKSTASAATCAAALVLLSGCQFFGIDTRPDIRYVTEKERKNVTEPMYSMPVAGTNLFKQWPMRLGPDYGTPPWEKKRNGAVAANAPTTNGVPAQDGVAAATTQTPPDNANSIEAPASASAAPNKAIALAAAAKAANKPTSATAKPSHRATPRLASGDLAESTASPATANEPWNAERNAATHGDGIVVTDDLDVPPAARGELEFRAPSASAASMAQPKAAAALVAPAGSAARKTRPSVEEDLAWGGAASDDSREDAIADADSNAAIARPAPPSASGIALQQPGAFAARKVAMASPPRSPNRAATARNNVLRDEAVRPASSALPLAAPSSAPAKSAPNSRAPRYHSPHDNVPPLNVDEELIPPGEEDFSDDPLSQWPPQRTVIDEVGNEAPVIDGCAFGLLNHASPSSSTLSTTALSRPRPAPRVVAPAAMMAEPTRVDERQGAYRPQSDDGDDTVFVTASDMAGDELPYGGAAPQNSPARNYAVPDQPASPPRVYTNPYFTAEKSPDAPLAEGDGSFDRSETSDKLSELEAAKRRILQ